MLVNPGLRRFLGSGDFVSLSASFSTPTITITATTNFSLTGGRFGAAISVNGAAAVWYDGVGAAASQSLALTLTDIGAVAGDLICIDVGYSLTDPATTKVYASASGLYITPSITTPTISDTTPTVGDTLTGTNGTALAQYTNATQVGATRTLLWLADGSSTGDTDSSYSVVVGDVGKVLTYRNRTTFGGVNTDKTSAATDPVSAGYVAITQTQAMVILGAGATSVAVPQVSAVGSNRLLVAIVNIAAGQVVSSITDDFGDAGTWSSAIIGPSTTIVGTDLYMFWKQTGTTNGSGKTVTFQGNVGTGLIVGAWGEWQPASAATFSLDGTPVTASGNSATPSAGNITLASSSGLIVCGVGGDGATMTAGSGYTRDFTTGAYSARIAGEWKTAIAGTYAADWTCTAQNYAAVAAGFKAVA